MRKGRRYAWKWAMLGGVVMIILLYGMDLATMGIEKVNGPLEHAADESMYEYPPGKQPAEGAAEIQQENRQAQTQAQAQDQAQSPLPAADTRGLPDAGLQGLPPRGHETSVNRLADGTAGLVQSLSSGGIRLVVSLFDSLTH